jgi:hypothetical protein
MQEIEAKMQKIECGGQAKPYTTNTQTAHATRLISGTTKPRCFVNGRSSRIPTTEGPSDWDIAIAILYPNYAAFDQIDAKAMTIVVKPYRSRDAAYDSVKKRSDIREVVSSKVAREVTPK